MKIKWIAAMLIICCLSFQIPAFAATQHLKLVEVSKSNIVVSKDASSFSFDILITNDASFSSAEFGLRLDGDVTIKNLQLNEAIANASKIGPTLHNGIYYFGFFNSANNYKGRLKTFTLTFDYSGSLPASVAIVETNVSTLNAAGGVDVERSNPNINVPITREAAGNPSSPGDNPSAPGGNPSAPGGNPSAPGGNPSTPTGVNLGTAPDKNATVILDNIAAQTALGQAKLNKNNCKVITIDATKGNTAANEIAVLFPYSLLNTTEKRCLVITTPIATIQIPSNVLSVDQAAHATNLTLTVKKLDTSLLPSHVKKQLGNHPAIEIQFAVDGQVISWSNDQVPVKISIPYTPITEEIKNTDQLIISYVDNNNSLHVVSSSSYDAKAGAVTFSVHHFSSYGITFIQKTFTDIQSSWAKKEIEALTVREIITGTSTTTFSPNANITRADFTKLLVGVLGKKASQDGAGFSDVQASAYYYEAVMTAQALGLATGSGDNKFNPKALITRQEMISLIDRALTIAGKQLTEKSSLSRFKDASQLAPYAVDSAAKLVAAGVISGSNGNLRPRDHLQRDEAARVLYLVFKQLNE